MAHKLLDGVTAITVSRAIKCGEDIADHTVMVRFRDIGTTVTSALTIKLQGSLINDEATTGVIERAQLQIGTTVANVRNEAFYYLINGTKYAKAQVAAGTALTANVITQAKFGCINLFIYDSGQTITDAVVATPQA